MASALAPRRRMRPAVVLGVAAASLLARSTSSFFHAVTAPHHGNWAAVRDRQAAVGSAAGCRWPVAVAAPTRTSRMASRAAAVAAATDACGVVTFDREAELAVEDTVTVFYEPPAGLFDGDLFYCGGFNGWDGDQDPVMMPMLREADGRYRVSINIPNFAKVLDFVFTDGVRYDTGPDGAFFHLRVTHVRQEDDNGNIITFRQNDDGSLVKTGMIERVDPQELERMVDEGLDKVMNEGLRNEIMVSVDEQASVQQMRAEASVLGERLGLGNMQVNEARDAFDRHDDANGLLSFEGVGAVFAELGLDELTPARLAELIDSHVFDSRPDATRVTLYEFMHMFSELDKADTGIDMV